MSFPNIFRAGRIGNLTIKNRLVMPPMATNLANADGSVSPAIIDYYKERAKGGVGLIIIENVQVDYPCGKDISCQLRIDDLKYAAGFFDLTEAVHNYDTKIFMQLQHSGRQSNLTVTEGVELVAPSPIPDPGCNIQPRELTIDEIEKLIQKFVNAAIWAKIANCDGVEIHGAHGYLINEFMSPRTNIRVDLYGGSFEKRMKFPLEIIKRVRAACGEGFAISFRLSADEFIGDLGNTLEEGKKIAKVLEAAGVDILHVSSGIYESITTLLEPQGYEQGWRAYLAEEIRKVVNIPVIAVGVIREPEVAEQILSDEKVDFVAIGRTLIADPYWPLKAKTGKSNEIRKCISCNQGCIGGNVHPGRRLRCTVNPIVGHEGEYAVIEKAKESKKVLVIGGGPAGMQAAITATARGHLVILLEKSDRLGGQLNIAQIPPDKASIGWVTEWMSSEMNRQKVDIRLNTEATVDLVKSLSPDIAIVATGSLPLTPKICGVAYTMQAWDLLSGKVELPINKNIVIIGGGVVGAETAHYLADSNNVSILEMLPTIANDLESTTRGYLMGKLSKASVTLNTDAIVTEITDAGVYYIAKNMRTNFIKADSVILSVGQTSIGNKLAEEIEAAGIRTRQIGDSLQVGKVIDGIRNGFHSAIQL